MIKILGNGIQTCKIVNKKTAQKTAFYKNNIIFEK